VSESTTARATPRRRSSTPPASPADTTGGISPGTARPDRGDRRHVVRRLPSWL